MKPRDIPEDLLELEVLTSRLKQRFKGKNLIADEAARQRAGYNGEKSIDYFLTFLDKKAYSILNYLRLCDEHGAFQLDTLILTPSFILNIEVKHVSGKIVFDSMKQAVRTNTDGESQYFNPLDQVHLQRLRLHKWLMNHGFPKLPIVNLIVYTNSNCILLNNTDDPLVRKTVIRKESLISKIQELTQIHQKKMMKQEQLQHLITTLINKHTPLKRDLMGEFGVKVNHLRQGVICIECSGSPMKWNRGKWFCAFCKNISNDAHINALYDYSMLINTEITNRQAREFLQIEGTRIMHRLLKNMNLPEVGKTSDRKYNLAEFRQREMKKRM